MSKFPPGILRNIQNKHRGKFHGEQDSTNICDDKIKNLKMRHRKL